MSITYDSPITDLGLTTQAPKTLADDGITTVEQLLTAGRDRISRLKGMGSARLTDVDAAIARHGLAWHVRADIGKWNTCKTCPACPDCGNPRATDARATDARAVVTDLDGRAVHHGHRAGPVCNSCDEYHRALVAGRALELAGRLA